MEADLFSEEEDFYKCRKHPSRRRPAGVCPSCLRDRLLLLCPDCANVRPCSCLPSSSSSSSSSFSSNSSSFVPARSSVSGAIGRISTLIDSEPAFHRSRSTALPFLRRRLDREEEEEEKAEKREKWGSFWGFLKGREKGSEIEAFSKSGSVGVPISGRKWYFPSPMRAFRSKKMVKVVQERPALVIIR